MRNLTRKTAITLIAIIMLLVAPMAAFASSEADFNGQGAPTVWEYDTANVTAYGYDAFGSLTKDLSPGDVRNVAATIRNNTADNVEFRLVVNPVSLRKAQAIASSNFPDKTADDSLLDIITITVRHGAMQLYNGTLRGAASVGGSAMYTADGVSLGILPGGYGTNLTFELSVPSSLGPGAMNTLCAIEWRFVATQYNDVLNPPKTPNPPTSPSGDGGGGAGTVTATGGAAAPPVIGDTPVSELPDTQTPGAPDISVDDKPTPTGSGAGAPAWALLNLILTIVAALLMIAFIGRYIYSRSKVRESEESKMQRSGEYIDLRLGRKIAAGGVGIIMAVAAVILFITIEDMTLPMEFINKYTPWYVLFILFELAALPLSAKKRREQTA